MSDVIVEKINGPVYVDKKHYDSLLAAFARAKTENNRLKVAWKELDNRLQKFDDRVLEDIHRFDSLKEESAYMIGSFNTMIAMKYTLDELEGAYDVKIDT